VAGGQITNFKLSKYNSTIIFKNCKQRLIPLNLPVIQVTGSSPGNPGETHIIGRLGGRTAKLAVRARRPSYLCCQTARQRSVADYHMGRSMLSGGTQLCVTTHWVGTSVTTRVPNEMSIASAAKYIPRQNTSSELNSANHFLICVSFSARIFCADYIFLSAQKS